MSGPRAGTARPPPVVVVVVAPVVLEVEVVVLVAVVAIVKLRPYVGPPSSVAARTTPTARRDTHAHRVLPEADTDAGHVTRSV